MNRVFSKLDEIQFNVHLAKSQTQERKLTKGFTVPDSSTGGLGYFPVSTEIQRTWNVDFPLRGLIPRSKVTGGLGFTFKRISDYNTSNVSGKVQDGRRGRFIATEIEDEQFQWAIYGYENFATFNSQLVSENYEARDQAVALMQETLGYAVAEDEEKKIIGGNRTALSEIEAVVATANTTDVGGFAAGDFSVVAIPLTHYALENSSVTAGVILTHKEQNADGSLTTVVGGYGKQKSTTVTLADDNSIDVLVADVTEAAGYAVFVGAAGSEKLAYVGPSNKVTILEVDSSAQDLSNLVNADQSADKLDFDGIYSLLGHRGGFKKSLDGAELTIDGLYCEEFEVILREMNDRKSNITHIVLNSKTYDAYWKKASKNITQVNVIGGEVPMLNFGLAIGTYSSPSNTTKIPFIIDRFIPDGQVLFLSLGSAAKVQINGNLWEMMLQEDMNLILWPLVTRSHQVGLYNTGALISRYTGGNAILKNIKI